MANTYVAGQHPQNEVMSGHISKRFLDDFVAPAASMLAQSILQCNKQQLPVLLTLSKGNFDSSVKNQIKCGFAEVPKLPPLAIPDIFMALVKSKIKIHIATPDTWTVT